MRLANYLLSPEFYFVLFLFSGYFKILFEWVPIDITILTLGITILFSIPRLLSIRKIKIEKLLFFLTFVLFIGYAISSLSWSDAQSSGIIKAVEMIALTLPSLAIPLLVFDHDSMPSVAFTIVLLGSVLSFLTLPTILSNVGAIGYITFMDIGHMGVSRLVGSSILILVFYYYTNSNKLSFKLLMVVLIVVNGITLLAAGSRAPLLGLILAVIYYLYQSVSYSNGVISYSKELKWIVPALLVLIFILTKAIQQGYFATIVYRVQMIFEESGGGASLMSRSELIDVALYLFRENPVTGVGLGGFAAYHNIHVYPHNIVLEILSELGLVGIIFFGFVLITIIKPSISLFRYRKEKVWTLLLLYFFINALISGDLNTNRMIYAFMSIIVVVYSSLISEEKDLEIEHQNDGHQFLINYDY